MVRVPEKVKLARHLQLFPERFGVDAYAHLREFVAALCHGVPDEYVTVETVHRSAVLRLRLRDPIIVVCRPHFVRVTVFEGANRFRR